MSDIDDVQEYIDRENRRRSPDNGAEEDANGGDEGEEKSGRDRLRESVLDGVDEG